VQQLAGLIPYCLSLLICLMYRSTVVFAQATDSNAYRTGLFSVIMWVVVWTLVFVIIGLGICTWLRGNRSTFSRRLRRKIQGRAPNGLPSLHTMASAPSRRMIHRCGERRERTAPTEPQPDTPEWISLKQLEQVVSLRKSESIREYYDSISIIAKRYVEEKYQIKTIDETTGQILESLPHDLTDTAVDHVGEILRTCDMIHFSGHRPSRSDIDNIYRTAKEFLESQIVNASDETATSEDQDNMGELTEHYRRMV